MKTLLKKGYKTLTKKSSSKIVLTRGTAARLYQRFVRGEETVHEQHWFAWSPGWSFGRFHDANGLELIDEHQSGDEASHIYDNERGVISNDTPGI